MAIWAKNPYFRPPGGSKSGENEFLGKSENVMFLHSLRLSFMPKIRKIYRAVFRERGGETERQKDRERERERERKRKRGKERGRQREGERESD